MSPELGLQVKARKYRFDLADIGTPDKVRSCPNPILLSVFTAGGGRPPGKQLAHIVFVVVGRATGENPSTLQSLGLEGVRRGIQGIPTHCTCSGHDCACPSLS
jgi:hypothetical protein